MKSPSHLEEQIDSVSSVRIPPALRPDANVRMSRRWDWLLAAVLILVSVIVLRGVRVGEFDYNVDEAQHAVTGLFITDVLRDLPLRHPIQYAYNYYAQYPAVAIVHWPPLFYVVEGMSFLALGPSVLAARLAVLLFALLLLYEWYRLVESFQDPLTAAVSTVTLAFVPGILLFEKTVMLEIPSLALGVGTIRAWISYLREGDRRSLYRFGAWIAAALLCKQTSIYLLLFCALTIVVSRKWERLLTRDFLVVCLLCTVVVGAFYSVMLVAQAKAVANDLGSHQLSGLDRFTFYLRTLPLVTSLPVSLLALLGLVFSRKWDERAHTQIMLCWCIAGYLIFTMFGQREVRFAVYWLPPVTYFAVGFLMRYFRAPKVRFLARAAALVLIGGLTAHAWRFERPYISGYQAAAAQLVNAYKSGIVLFDGEVPGNFVFYMRALDPARQFLVLRKSLYANDIRQSAQSEELLHTQDELLSILREDGVRFIVVLDHAPIRFHVQGILRKSLKSDQFALRGSFPIESNERNWQGRQLLLYENKAWAPPTGKVLRLRMLTLDHDILVPLEHFDFASKAQPEGSHPAK